MYTNTVLMTHVDSSIAALVPGCSYPINLSSHETYCNVNNTGKSNVLSRSFEKSKYYHQQSELCIRWNIQFCIIRQTVV